MATGTWDSASESETHAGAMSHDWVARSRSVPLLILKTLASLKITVTLFALGIFIILVGTLAQVDKDMWEVIDLYFRSWITRIEFQVFFPRSWAPRMQNIPGAFWFPGGAMIGAAMAVNLIAAHSIRFKAQASGSRLWTGLVVLVVGILMTGYIIVSGHNHAGLQGEPPFSWQTLWTMVKVGVGFGCAASIYFALTTGTGAGAESLSGEKGSASKIDGSVQKARVMKRLWWASAAGLGGISLWLFLARENAYLGDAGMRILWQLIQSTICGLVLLAGCIAVFGKRGGIVLIHAGVGLMMFGQFFVSKYDVEEQMRIEEGQTKSYAEDIRQTELAVIDSSDPKEDQVVAVPQSILEASLGRADSSLFSFSSPEVQDGIIRHPSLPFDLQVVKFFANSNVRDAKPDEPNLATAGFGKRLIAVETKPSAGADTDGTVDFAAAYIRLFEKDDSRELGTYLFSQLTSLQNLTEKVTVGHKTYDVSLRFRRNYKPYQITLKDVRKDDYVGTSTPRNYSSDIHLKDPARGVDREIHIWMNNPLRYAGETFYQSGYLGPPDAEVETTTLSVVTNAGWMIPYVSCMIVFVGLVSHFGNTLLRFLHRQVRGDVSAMQVEAPWQAGASEGKKRRDDQDRRQKSARDIAISTESAPSKSWKRFALPASIISPFVLMFLGSMFPTKGKPGEFNYREFGRLPVLEGGRVKPFDTLARNTLRVLSNRETFYDASQKRQPATRWLLDVISQSEVAEDHAVIRIDNLEVLDLLGLKRRKSHLYSVNEILPNAEKFEKQVDQAQEDRKKLGAENLTAYQRKLLELDGRVRSYTRIAATFKPPSLPPLPTQEEFEKDRATAQEKLTRFRDVYVSFMRSIESISPPLAIPVKPSKDSVHRSDKNWQSYAESWAMALIDAKLSGREPPPALKGFNEMLASYADGDADKFNKAVADYRRLLERERPAELNTASTFSNRMIARTFGTFYGFEEFFNQVSPFFFCWFPYLFAGVLAAASWLSRSQQLRRSAYWLILFAFIVHTLALGARIYISGRPPVTNLYSSAVFIGWAVVLFCLIWELIYKDGIATFLASALGFATLLIAHFLAGDGDTFTVLQAVLDTQFWLATHVVTITLGYAATFLAGGIGIMYILRGLATPSLDRTASSNLARMMYGTICFAMIFSFIGTVLGGLWADDSWGRFWGWDPKENGALIIVLWNALVLHAKWDGMIKDRGLAVLAVGGNIVTGWSWFGVNQLQVGLHSYGFTEGVLLALLVFGASQLVVILAGCMPKSLWMSFQVHGNPRAVSGREQDAANRRQVAQHA